MTDKYILAKDHLQSFLRRIKRKDRLVVPVKNQQGDTLFTEIDDLDQVDIDLASQPQTALKSFFFPPREVLFTYRSQDADYEFTPVYGGEPTVYFGLRSCDLSAILYTDVIFLQHAKDPYYLHRRQNSIFISIGCNDPFANCFCYATKSGPFLDFGYDLQFTDLGDRFFVEPGRVKGEELIHRWLHFFHPATQDDIKAQYQISLEARGSFKQRVDVETAIKRLAADDIPERVFASLSARCQDCGGCSYICPTCTCFTITDQALSPDAGERVRTWDACTFSGFTKMAGGHNPVSRPAQAIEKRFRHKLQQDVKKHGRPSCVGCGRCVDMCFDGVDIIRFIKMVCNEH
jgi:sulfhydrogenase subunit beta (sulfur reductase)